MQKQLLLVKSKPFLTNTVSSNLETWKTSSHLTSHSFFTKQCARKRAMTSPTWPVAQQRKHLQKKTWKAVQNQKQSMGTQSNQISYLLSCLPYPISSVISSKSTIINYYNILTCRAVTSLRFLLDSGSASHNAAATDRYKNVAATNGFRQMLKACWALIRFQHWPVA